MKIGAFLQGRICSGDPMRLHWLPMLRAIPAFMLKARLCLGHLLNEWLGLSWVSHYGPGDIWVSLI